MRRAGGIGRGGTGVNVDPWTTYGDAPVGPRRSGDGKANTVDTSRDGAPRPGQRSEMNCYQSVPPFLEFRQVSARILLEHCGFRGSRAGIDGAAADRRSARERHVLREYVRSIRPPVDHFDQRVDRTIHAGPVAPQQ
jgi:hypothetical protein